MSVLRTRLRQCLVTTVAGALAAAALSTAALAESTSSSPSPVEPPASASAPSDPADGETDESAPSDTPAPEAPSPGAESAEKPAAPQGPDKPAAPEEGAPQPDADDQPSDGQASEDPTQAQSSEAQSSEAQISIAAASTANNPEGTMGAWAGGDGLIYFSGYAFDRDDFGATVTTMYTLDGTVVGFQPAQLRSPELDPYGLPYKGVFGAFQAPSAGQHQLCMFIFNIGGGTDTLASCVDVNVPSKNPRGDIVVEVIGSQIRVNGWLFDESNPPQSLAMWVVDNGQVVSSFVANAPSPYLYSYGVFGSHAFGTQYTPSSSGSHQICVYGINVGFGQNSWIDCDTVSVDITADNPKGELILLIEDYDENGFNDLYADAYAYDPNDPSAALEVAIAVDGQLVDGGTADWYSRDWNPAGIPGDHGYFSWLGEEGWEFTSGSHTVCLYAYNIGPGTGQWIQCVEAYL